MEEKKNNNVILIIIGLLLVAGISLFIGMNIGNSNNDNNTNVSENAGQDNNENKEEVVELDEVDALNVVQNVYDNAKKFYDPLYVFDDCTWKTDNDSCVNLSDFWNKNPNGGYIKITNYDEVMNDIFTINGLKQYEKFMSEEFSTPFIKEENGNMYVEAPSSGLYTGYVTKNLKITNISENEIQATIDVVASALFFGEEEDVTETKKIIIKKENNKWLIEEFAIPMHY